MFSLSKNSQRIFVAGLLVVLWVCDLSLYSNRFAMGLWFVMWVCVLWWLWIVFVYSGGDVVWITHRIIRLIWWRGAGELGRWGVEEWSELMRWAWLTAKRGSKATVDWSVGLWRWVCDSWASANRRGGREKQMEREWGKRQRKNSKITKSSVKAQIKKIYFLTF